ncbi:replicative helicase loader/inhibitor [Paenibacillus sp. FSL H7-0714]|uniref:replicative helicase loader/inhibitor n=1 Tax=Paenibacillus sp. FSL H7-0714 TaxID=2954735 RepID=UPI0030F57981
MNNQETSSLLAVIKTAFPEFAISNEVIQVWYLFLQEIPYDRAQRNLRDHIATSRFAPRIADVIREDLHQPLTIYEIQRQEQEQATLELMEYHATENVKPMPERVSKYLENFFTKVRLNDDEP